MNLRTITWQIIDCDFHDATFKSSYGKVMVPNCKFKSETEALIALLDCIRENTKDYGKIPKYNFLIKFKDGGYGALANQTKIKYIGGTNKVD